VGGLADEFKSFQREYRPSNGPACAVGEVLKALNPPDQKAFLLLLEDTRIYGTSLAVRLRDIADRLPDEDLKMARLFRACGAPSIQRHRRGECRCSRA
jgi:hypothetical protein